MKNNKVVSGLTEGPEISAEAVLKTFPNKLVNVSNKSSTSHKDDDDSSNDVISFVVDVVINGYVLLIIREDGLEEKYIFDNFDDVLSAMKKAH
jgi:hypothetical protein